MENGLLFLLQNFVDKEAKWWYDGFASKEAKQQPLKGELQCPYFNHTMNRT